MTNNNENVSCLITQNQKNSISVAGLNMRTTSSIESLNSVVQRKFPKSRNIFSFIEGLRLEDAIKTSDLYQLLIGNVSNQQLMRKRLTDQYRDQKIRSFSARYQNGTVSIEMFLKLVSLKCKKPKKKNRHIVNQIR